MVERGTVGGTCVNTGCVPSKALLAAAEARHVSQEARFPGITSAPFGVDPRRLIGGKDELVAALRAVVPRCRRRVRLEHGGRHCTLRRRTHA